MTSAEGIWRSDISLRATLTQMCTLDLKDRSSSGVNQRKCLRSVWARLRTRIISLLLENVTLRLVCMIKIGASIWIGKGSRGDDVVGCCLVVGEGQLIIHRGWSCLSPELK